MDESFIALRVAKLRLQKNVSAREMSLAIGQANNYINTIENGKALPSISGLLYICEYLGVTPSEFFDEGNTDPTLLGEVVRQLKPLSPEKLRAILTLTDPNKR